MGAHRPAGQARRAARCRTPDSEMAGKRRNAPGRADLPSPAEAGFAQADVPHPKGRALFVASGVARCLRCLAPRREALLTGDKKSTQNATG